MPPRQAGRSSAYPAIPVEVTSPSRGGNQRERVLAATIASAPHARSREGGRHPAPNALKGTRCAYYVHNCDDYVHSFALHGKLAPRRRQGSGHAGRAARANARTARSFQAVRKGRCRKEPASVLRMRAIGLYALMTCNHAGVTPFRMRAGLFYARITSARPSRAAQSPSARNCILCSYYVQPRRRHALPNASRLILCSYYERPAQPGRKVSECAQYSKMPV
jgi:hypothetical protein